MDNAAVIRPSASNTGALTSVTPGILAGWYHREAVPANLSYSSHEAAPAFHACDQRFSLGGRVKGRQYQGGCRAGLKIKASAEFHG